MMIFLGIIEDRVNSIIQRFNKINETRSNEAFNEILKNAS